MLAIVANSQLDSRAIVHALDMAIETPGLDPLVKGAIVEAKRIYFSSLRRKKTASELGIGGDPHADFGPPPIGGGQTTYRPY